MQRLIQLLREKISSAGGGFPALLAARMLMLGYSFAVSVAILWKFGVPATGSYALASFPAAASTLVSTMGLQNALPRRPLGDGERATIGLVAALLVLLPIAAACAAYGVVVGETTSEAEAIALFAIAGAFGQLGTQQVLLILQRRTAWAPLAPAIYLGGLGLAALAPTLAGFALVVAVSRLVGCLLGFAPLSFARTSLERALGAVREGLQFTALDFIAMASELAPVPLLALSLSRPEIGVFGLARQFVTVADTPGYSFVQAQYPTLVADVASAGAIAPRNAAIAWAAAATVLPLASFLALAVYHLPVLVGAIPIVLLPMRWRYTNNLCDQALRAAGRVRECALLGIGKLALSCVLFATMAGLFGFWGAIAGFAILSVASGLGYRWGLTACYPQAMARQRAWSPA